MQKDFLDMVLYRYYDVIESDYKQKFIFLNKILSFGIHFSMITPFIILWNTIERTFIFLILECILKSYRYYVFICEGIRINKERFKIASIVSFSWILIMNIYLFDEEPLPDSVDIYLIFFSAIMIILSSNSKIYDYKNIIRFSLFLNIFANTFILSYSIFFNKEEIFLGSTILDLYALLFMIVLFMHLRTGKMLDNAFDRYIIFFIKIEKFF